MHKTKGGEKMLKYIIHGGNRLEGEVEISGSKNASLPIIAATILNQGKTTLYNVPEIHDTKMMFEILKELGGNVTKKVSKSKGKTIKKYIIDTSKINKYKISEKLMCQMRSSVIFVGALLGRYGKSVFYYPEVCKN